MAGSEEEEKEKDEAAVVGASITFRSFPRKRESRTSNSNVEQVALDRRFRGGEQWKVSRMTEESLPGITE
jgi:hypothetical protein